MNNLQVSIYEQDRIEFFAKENVRFTNNYDKLSPFYECLRHIGEELFKKKTTKKSYFGAMWQVKWMQNVYFEKTSMMNEACHFNENGDLTKVSKIKRHFSNDT